MIYEAIGLGLIIGLVFSEVLGLTAGGLIPARQTRPQRLHPTHLGSS